MTTASDVSKRILTLTGHTDSKVYNNTWFMNDIVFNLTKLTHATFDTFDIKQNFFYYRHVLTPGLKTVRLDLLSIFSLYLLFKNWRYLFHWCSH